MLPTLQQRKKLQGLGDLVELAAKVTGVKTVVDTVSKATGKDCGCGRRRDKLNELMPFKKGSADGVQRDED
jgi:hypothetical protein